MLMPTLHRRRRWRDRTEPQQEDTRITFLFGYSFGFLSALVLLTFFWS